MHASISLEKVVGRDTSRSAVKSVFLTRMSRRVQNRLSFEARRGMWHRQSWMQPKSANRVRSFDDDRSTVIPWVSETGIVDHLKGLKKDEIKAATALPSPENDSSYLSQVIEAAESMPREAHSWCFDGDDCVLTWPCRVVLSRFQSSQTESCGNLRPFDQYKEPKQIKTYFSTAKRVLAYFGRVTAGENYFFTPGSCDPSK